MRSSVPEGKAVTHSRSRVFCSLSPRFPAILAPSSHSSPTTTIHRPETPRRVKNNNATTDTTDTTNSTHNTNNTMSTYLPHVNIPAPCQHTSLWLFACAGVLFGVHVGYMEAADLECRRTLPARLSQNKRVERWISRGLVRGRHTGGRGDDPRAPGGGMASKSNICL